MKRNEKIMIGILALILLVMIGLLILNKTKIKKEDIWDYKNNPFSSNEVNNLDDNSKELGRIVKIKGTLYYDTGKKSTELRCGMMDGKIISNVGKDQIPTEDNQSNFEGEYGYQFWEDNAIQIFINNEWCIFKAKDTEIKHIFYGKVVESNSRTILVEPNEGEEIRKSADKIEIGLGENNDAIYEIGTNVKITYKGYVMESYPAKVETVNIEVKSADKFEIRFYDKHPQTDNKVYKILDKVETNKYDYNVYAYDGQVNILINEEEISLRNALLNNKITMDEIIAKANKDLDQKKISGDMYKDGGSMIYKYDNYTIIKCHTVEGNRDVYIGTPELNINDLK